MWSVDPPPPPSLLSEEYRFVFTKVRGGVGWAHIQLQEVRLYGANASMPLSIASISNPGGASPTNQPPADAIDGDLTTPGSKWLDLNFGEVGNSTLLLRMASPQVVAAYGLMTANDVERRDPVSWEFSRNVEGEWVVMDTQDDFPAPMARQTWYSVTLPSMGFALYSPPPSAPPPSRPAPHTPALPPLQPPSTLQSTTTTFVGRRWRLSTAADALSLGYWNIYTLRFLSSSTCSEGTTLDLTGVRASASKTYCAPGSEALCTALEVNAPRNALTGRPGFESSSGLGSVFKGAAADNCSGICEVWLQLDFPFEVPVGCVQLYQGGFAAARTVAVSVQSSIAPGGWVGVATRTVASCPSADPMACCAGSWSCEHVSTVTLAPPSPSHQPPLILSPPPPPLPPPPSPPTLSAAPAVRAAAATLSA